MRKKILLMLSAFCFIGATVFGQAIEGGAGIIHVDGDPNDNEDLNNVTVNEGNIAYDKDNQIVYYYGPLGADAVGPVPGPAVTGTHWIAVDVSAIVNPITSILTPEDELTATVTGTGEVTITFTSDATLGYDSGTNILTFTDVDGGTHPVDLSDLSTPVSAADPSITVTNVGTAANPDYEISLTGANGATPGTVPVTNGTTGALTWTNVVQSAAIGAEGQLALTMTDGSTVNLDLDSAPKVTDEAGLIAAAAALPAGETGIAVADDSNLFGLPSTSDYGLIFFVKSTN